jgi:outer membrane protein W
MPNSMKLVTVYFILFTNILQAQSYLNNKSKYQFAQGAMGVDFQYISRTGSTNTITNGKTKSYQFGGYTIPRLVIGGLHFWGHADIAFNFPLGKIGTEPDSIAISYSDFDIMTFKYYPWAIQKSKIRPFVGTSANINKFSQQGTEAYKNYYGGRDYKFSFPFTGGFILQKGNWLINAEGKLNVNPNRIIYASRTETTNMNVPKYTFSFGVRNLFESTAPKFEKKFSDGTMKKDYEDNQHKLNAYSFGLGFSSAIQTAAFNDQNRKYLSNNPGTFFPEFAIGYYLNKPDIQFNVAYRNTNANEFGFGLVQQCKRQALTLEGYKFLFDYKGFVPFLGLGIG